MPGKPVSILMIVLVIAFTWGFSRVDWPRNVKPYPPNYSPAGPPRGHVVDLPEPAPDVDPARVETGGQETPEVPEPPTEVPEEMPIPGEDEPIPEEMPVPGEDEPIPEEMPIPEEPAPEKPGPRTVPKYIDLAEVNAQRASSIPAGSVVRIVINREGVLRSGGIQLGSYRTMTDRCKWGGGDQVVILAHEETPWKYVYWAADAVRDAGAKRVAFGVRVKGREAMLMAAVPGLTPEYPEGLEEYRITIGRDGEGKVTYRVHDVDVEDLLNVGRAVEEYGEELADNHGANYSRKPEGTPWVIAGDPEVATGEVLKVIAVTRNASIYLTRLGGELPERPK